jgi:hypothetical protein
VDFLEKILKFKSCQLITKRFGLLGSIVLPLAYFLITV